MVQTLLIDDEPDARAVLRKMIGRYCPLLNVCSEAATLEEALAAIQQYRPDLIFLDIDLGDGNGFDILKAFPNPDFHVIFVTAHDDFAVEAFRVRALHYLLKPIDPQDLIAAANALGGCTGQAPVRAVSPAGSKEKVWLPSINGIVQIHPEEILFAVANDKYASVSLRNGDRFFVSWTLKELESLLPADDFFRPHQSWLVSLQEVRKVQRTPFLSLILTDGTSVPVSRRNRKIVMQRLGIDDGS